MDKSALMVLTGLGFIAWANVAKASENDAQEGLRNNQGNRSKNKGLAKISIPINPPPGDIDVSMPNEDIVIKPGAGYEKPSNQIDLINIAPSVKASEKLVQENKMSEVDLVVKQTSTNLDKVFYVPSVNNSVLSNNIVKVAPGQIVTEKHPTGIIYVIDPNLIQTTLPITLLFNDSLQVSLESARFRLYKRYDVIANISNLNSLNLISTVVNPDLTPIVSYYYDLIKDQIRAFNNRKAIINSLSYTDSNIRAFDILELVIDSFMYNSSTVKNLYKPITSVSIVKSITPTENAPIVTVVTEKAKEETATRYAIYNLSDKPGSNIGPFFVPDDEETHTYTITNKDYVFAPKSIFGFVRTSDNKIIEIDFSLLYNYYKDSKLVQLFEYAAKLFMSALGKHTAVEINTTSVVYNTYKGRAVMSPDYGFVTGILYKFNINYDIIDVPIVLFAKKYNVPVRIATKFYKNFTAFKEKVNNPNLDVLDYYESQLLHTNIDSYRKNKTAYTNQLNYLLGKDLRTRAFGETYNSPKITSSSFGSYSGFFVNTYKVNYSNNNLFKTIRR